MEKLSVSDDLWSDILSGQKTKLYYKGEKTLDLGSYVLETNLKNNKEVVRITKVYYNKDKNITVVDFEL